MTKTLVIVESPAKAKTIGKFLGSKYKVIASNGHVRDLPKSKISIDVENGFTPKYITLRGRGDVLEKIRKEAKASDRILLATDPDREGEAISWHLCSILNLDQASTAMHDACTAIKMMPLSFEGIKLSITITIGVAENDFHSPLHAILEEADRKLYMGKNSGRDQVVL